MTTEMKSQPVKEPTPSQTPDLDPKALAAIRDLLQSEADTAAKPAAVALPEAVPVAKADVEPAPAPEAPVAATRRVERASDAMPHIAPAANDHEEAVAAGPLARLKARITGYRPTPRHLVIAACALVVLFRPWLVVGLILLTLFVFIGIFLILGYDGFWKRTMGLARWYARRRPSRAVELHRKLDNFAMKWDAFLDRFPEGSVDGLYLPDFGELATADARHDEALDRRLSSLREGEV